MARGIYGLVWLDDGLVARKRYGKLVDFVTLERPISDSVLPLIGLEEDIVATTATPGAVLAVPAVSIVDAAGATPRLNLTVLALRHETPQFLLLVTRAVSRSDAEFELTRQTRGRLMAEAELVVRSRELARANRDLEDFASIVSHDLNAPMRTMRYLTDELEGRLRDRDAGDPLATLDQIRGLSRRLTTMMSGLLEYSSVGRKRDAIETVDTRQLIEAIVLALPRPPGFRIAICGNWPRLRTLVPPLDLVLRNLLDNAVKHHDRPDGTITVTAHEQPDLIEITVADDGPGIAEEHREAVFLPFRTLASPGTDSGSGLGLAMVKRTIEQIGGRLSLSSSALGGRGTVFTIYWPKTIMD